MSTFQIIVIAIFIFLAIVGVALFAGFGGINKKSMPSATIWGTVSAQNVSELIRNINGNSTVVDVKYVQKDPATFDKEFVNALAEGTGPDVILLADNMLYQERNKLLPIGYKTFPEREFKDTFIDEATHFMNAEGILAVPFSIDPMVMFWNKDIFSSAAVPRPPKLWTDLSIIGPSIIKRTDTSNITTALVPFGEYRNVTHAKELLAALLLQAGNTITALDLNSLEVYSTLDENSTKSIVSPTESVMSFFTEFSNPLKSLYTWNRSLPESEDAFLAGDLALHFGFASELQKLHSKNPNLNFDVTLLPQPNDSPKATYGRMTALGIVKNSKNISGALTVIGAMTSNKSLEFWTTVSGLPPVRRDLLSVPPKEAYMSVFYEAALQSKTWFDPDAVQSDYIFQDMVESITTGRDKNTDAISLAKQKLDNLLRNN